MPAECVVSSLLCLRGKRNPCCQSPPRLEQQLARHCPTLILELHAPQAAEPRQSHHKALELNNRAGLTGVLEDAARGRGRRREAPRGPPAPSLLSPGVPTHTYSQGSSERGRATSVSLRGTGIQGVRAGLHCCPSPCRQRRGIFTVTPRTGAASPPVPRGQPRCDCLSKSLRHPAGLQRAGLEPRRSTLLEPECGPQGREAKPASHHELLRNQAAGFRQSDVPVKITFSSPEPPGRGR